MGVAGWTRRGYACISPQVTGLLAQGLVHAGMLAHALLTRPAHPHAQVSPSIAWLRTYVAKPDGWKKGKPVYAAGVEVGDLTAGSLFFSCEIPLPLPLQLKVPPAHVDARCSYRRLLAVWHACT